ncbi:ferrous iron transport protein B [Candidatus Micrarchaeota archaeon]|nr:MAG: ferrous iron transport protein B [Candidatus Micrarchaeota archaeon]
MRKLCIALAGNANVGKSTLFNYLTGLHQHIGNWPGKTIEKAEGRLDFKGVELDVLDLPGIYSLSTFSLEELISRDYIAKQKPDVVINIVDASVLERNLFFTLQLLELGSPVVIALNMVDIARKRGIEIDADKLSKKLGVPVVPITATTGKGVFKLMEEALKTSKKKQKPYQHQYKKPMEAKIRAISKQVEKLGLAYPSRWLAIKLLEEDEYIVELVKRKNPKIIETVAKFLREIERRCGQPGSLVVSSERYCATERITRECMTLKKTDVPLSQKLDSVLLHKYFGYLFLLLAAGAIFFSIFTIGDAASEYLLNFFSLLKAQAAHFGQGPLQEIIFEGVVEGLIAGISIALPYLIPFYVILAILEDSGYLARMAFLMDGAMHKIGLHGKAFIPIMLAYGCNVPACLSCRILERQRDRLLASFVVTLVPCAAVTVVIMGLVATFVGFEWALGLYLLNLLVILVLGRIAFKALPGEPVGLIMEMPSYKLPMLSNIAMEAWRKLRSFVFMAFPIIIISTFLIKLIEVLGWLPLFSNLLSPITVGWLGLPAIVGITLIFGALRKELALIMLAALLGTEAFNTVLTPVQMITFAIVTMFYVPCAATVAALKKEHGWKVALSISAFEIAFAILLAGIMARLLEAFVF